MAIKKTNKPAVKPELTIDVKDVLVYSKDTKQVLLFGQPISDIELKSLKEEAKALKTFRIWRIMQETLKHHAVQDGFLNALNWEQTLAGKMMVHSLGVIASIANLMERYEVPVIKK